MLQRFLFFQERLTARHSIALCAGFAGILVLASGKMAGMSVGWASLAGALASMAGEARFFDGFLAAALMDTAQQATKIRANLRKWGMQFRQRALAGPG